jgi:hypothetical protein
MERGLGNDRAMIGMHTSDSGYSITESVFERSEMTRI